MSSCSRKKWDGNVQQLDLPETGSGRLMGILIDSQSRIYIIGGEKLDRNDFFQSLDNGITWTVNHFSPVDHSNKAGECIASVHDSIFVGCFDGKVFRNTDGNNNNWQLGLGNSWWYTFSGLCFTQNSIGFASGNKGYQKGIIVKFDTKLNTHQVDSFPFALNDVSFVNNDLGYAVGYGSLLQTKDGGASWHQLNLTNDNYRSIFIVDSNNIWTIGFSGTIVHITENGNNIDKIRNGQNPVGNGDRYLDITFKGNEGYIVGEKGVVMHTSDGGKNWKKMKKFTNEDLYAVSFHPFTNEVFFVGNNNVAFKYTP